MHLKNSLLIVFEEMPQKLLTGHLNKDRPTAVGGTALTAIQIAQLLGYLAFMLERIIVSQLHTWLDILYGFDKNTPFLVHRFAIGIATVIDIAGIAAGAGSIDYKLLVYLEKKSMMPRHRLVTVALIGCIMMDDFAGVFNDTLTFADATQGKSPPTLNARSSYFKKRILGSFLLGH